ncbi:MAG TPA: sulfide/dihydroorotate dehydrogenase-like FAD/NAD-binding protein [Spirochaetota bacterium]|nr:sulfide/dihydroorotate dehydrogenase-like FAD/NAD-binding protein [Spirochaetota bacterium]HOK92475.1 sulfide/dihydroorotate dehydrogenase-like FAD/NAD-binding protein [Spirochaetota bacterium]HPD78707.1 sulfide/dihydroorotate dehydrogenase-like FAD/NAD-binding protein [Spirochaetota bacterium]HPP95656.1 sulfide/dihydroorotate dehydrogenase-like FAD/NAD-binding protein [Spirochaetota bacterium]
MYRIISNEIIKPSIGRMVVEAPYVAEHRKAGQFVMIMVDEKGERLPLTIADSTPEHGTITLIYQIVGTTTAKLSSMKSGDCLFAVAGPLGHPTEIKNYGTVVCAGGGIGIAPLFPIAKAMKASGNRVINILGARNSDLLILEEELRAVGDKIFICTDDGSRGEKGLITQPLTGILKEERVDLVVAVGPVPMMKAVSELTKEYNVKTFVSLNSIMIDGTGMCGGCRVIVGDELKFTCVDGPEFDGHLVDFESLGKRLKTYQKEETESFEQYKHKCKLEGAFNGK